jgi:hypothetical protein
MNVYSTATVLLALSLGLSFGAYSEETVLEKAETVKNKTVDGVKKGSRKVGEKYCETVNGKEHCTSKKLKNKVKNTTYEIKTDATEVINKID